jgi:hypothetical protein
MPVKIFPEPKSPKIPNFSTTSKTQTILTEMTSTILNNFNQISFNDPQKFDRILASK